MMVTPRKEEPDMGIELKDVIAEYVKAMNAHDKKCNHGHFRQGRVCQ
jgi:hypothetical protein